VTKVPAQKTQRVVFARRAGARTIGHPVADRMDFIGILIDPRSPEHSRLCPALRPSSSIVERPINFSSSRAGTDDGRISGIAEECRR